MNCRAFAKIYLKKISRKQTACLQQDRIPRSFSWMEDIVKWVLPMQTWFKLLLTYINRFKKKQKNPEQHPFGLLETQTKSMATWSHWSIEIHSRSTDAVKKGRLGEAKWGLEILCPNYPLTVEFSSDQHKTLKQLEGKVNTVVKWQYFLYLCKRH